jgi:hypothetical protein
LILKEALKCFSLRDFEDFSISGFLGKSPSLMANCYLTVPGQSVQKKFARSHLKGVKMGIVTYACHPRDGGKCKNSAQPGQKVRPYL